MCPATVRAASSRGGRRPVRREPPLPISLSPPRPPRTRPKSFSLRAASRLGGLASGGTRPALPLRRGLVRAPLPPLAPAALSAATSPAALRRPRPRVTSPPSCLMPRPPTPSLSPRAPRTPPRRCAPRPSARRPPAEDDVPSGESRMASHQATRALPSQFSSLLPARRGLVRRDVLHGSSTALARASRPSTRPRPRRAVSPPPLRSTLRPRPCVRELRAFGAAPVALGWTGVVEHSPRVASTQPFSLRLREAVCPPLRPRGRAPPLGQRALMRQRSPWPRRALPARRHPTASPAIRRRLLLLRPRAFRTRHPPARSPPPAPRNLL